MPNNEVAAVLLRVSHDPGGDARSIDGQRGAAKRDCENGGWVYGEEYEDTESASEFGAARGAVRHSFERLLVDIPTGRFTVLWVGDVSRTARDVSVLETLRKLLVRQKMRWCIGGRLMDPADAADTTLILIQGVLAQTEVMVRAKSVRRGIQEARIAGRAPSGVPTFGFLRPPRLPTQKVIQLPHPVNGPLVSWAITEAIPGGLSLGDIAAYWREHGETESKLSRTTVRRAILSPAVIGMTVHKGQLLRGDWEPLVTPEAYMTAKAVLAAPERRLSSSQDPTTLLSAIASCGRCGGYVGVLRAGKPTPIYKCTKGCGRAYGPTEPADARVTLALFEEIHSAARRAEVRRTEAPRPDARTDAQAELAAAEAEYQELNDHWHELGFNLLEYAAAVKPLRERVRVARKLAEAAVAPVVPPTVLDPTMYPALWERMTLEEQRRQVRHWLTVRFEGEEIHIESMGR